MKPLVGVVGKGRNAPSVVTDQAWLVGRIIAETRCLLVQGGLGGVMRAAAEGAHVHGGEVLSLLPTLEGNAEGGAHEYASLTIRTGLHHATRNIVMGSCCDLLVALPGSHGTMQEMAVALDVGTPVYFLEGYRPPLVSGCYATTLAGLRTRLVELVELVSYGVPQRQPRG